MKKIRVILLSCFLILTFLFASCGNGEETIATTNAEIGSEETTTSPKFRLVTEDAQLISICSPELYALLQEQQSYNIFDYSYTLKDKGDYGSNTDGALISWGYENPGDVKEVYVHVADNKELENATSIKAKKPTQRSKEGSVNVPNLFTNSTYYYQIEVTMKDETTVKSDVISFTTTGPRIMTISGIKNMRDLGGWTTLSGQKIRQGLIYRTARPNDLTPAGQIDMIELLNIRAELDLRNPDSETDAPVSSPLSEQIDYVNISGVSYSSFWSNPNRVAQEFEFFLHEENYPMFFHCAAGADRTGCLAYLIEALLGLDENSLVSDYEITPNRYRIGYEDSDNRFYDMIKFVETFKTFPGETLQEKARYFLKEQCLFSDESLDWFVDFMLEKE